MAQHVLWRIKMKFLMSFEFVDTQITKKIKENKNKYTENNNV